MNTGAVLMPVVLIDHIAGVTQGNGWLSGMQSEREQLFLPYKTKVGDEDFIPDSAPQLWSHRIGHRLQGNYEEQLVEWFKVEKGFNSRFRRQVELSEPEFQALVPAQLGQEGRVIIAIEPGEKGSVATAITASTKEGTVTSRPTEVILIPETSQALKRLPTTIVDALKGKSAIIVGLGSGGAEIALNLACTGLGKLALIDPDRVHAENYFRFIGGYEDLGRRKVDVVRSAIKGRQLQTDVSVHSLDIISDADKFRALVGKGADLLICATDSVASRRMANATAVLLGIPCILAGTLDGGRVGEILCVFPRQSPCHECVRMELSPYLEPPDSDDRSPNPYGGNEDKALTSAALRLDVTLVAALAARVALHVLAPEQFPGFLTNYIVWGRESATEYNEPFRFDVPFSTNYVPIKRRKDCPLCGALPSELAGVDIEETAREIVAAADPSWK